MFVYSLADRLNKSVTEILDLSVSEIQGWIGYYNIKQIPMYELENKRHGRNW